MSGYGMSGRSTGRVPEGAGKGLTRGQFDGRKRDDSLGDAVAAGGRVSAARAAAIRQGLTDLDRRVVGTVTTVRMASGRQLQRLHFGPGEAAARRAGRCLKRLTDLRVLGRLDRRVGGIRAGSAGFVYLLDVVGQTMTDGGGRRPWQLRQAFVQHSLLVTECFVCLKEAAPACGYRLVDFRTEPRCWRTFTGPAGLTVLKPDALAAVESGEFDDRWWLEVDNDTESPSRIARKAALYVQAYQLAITGREPFPKVLWVCTTAEREVQLRRALRGLPDEHWDLMAVTKLDALAAVIAAGPGACGLSPSDGGPR